jgi:hypothetical protein
MSDELLTIQEAIDFIQENYEPMYRVKLWMYCRNGWFEVVELPGGKPRIKKASVIDAYENPRPSSRYRYKGRAEDAVCDATKEVADAVCDAGQQEVPVEEAAVAVEDAEQTQEAEEAEAETVPASG